MIHFTVSGRAQPAGSKRAFVNKKTGRAQVVDANPKAKEWKFLVGREALIALAGRTLLDGPLWLVVGFFQVRPRGHYGTGANAAKLKASAPMYPTGPPDCTKLLRAVEDACQGVLYRNDSQIVQQNVCKGYGPHARVEVFAGTMNEYQQAEPTIYKFGQKADKT